MHLSLILSTLILGVLVEYGRKMLGPLVTQGSKKFPVLPCVDVTQKCCLVMVFNTEFSTLLPFFVHCLLHNSVVFSSSLGQFTEYKNLHQLNVAKPSSQINSQISVASCKIKVKVIYSLSCGFSVRNSWICWVLAAWFSIFRYFSFFSFKSSPPGETETWDTTIFFQNTENWWFLSRSGGEKVLLSSAL